ncbi:MAG: hypothetical protein FJ267_02180 [Planctomycetes bacterium]|nr:hypothetical protein [Planctomycetota bacterium]
MDCGIGVASGNSSIVSIDSGERAAMLFRPLIPIACVAAFLFSPSRWHQDLCGAERVEAEAVRVSTSERVEQWIDHSVVVQLKDGRQPMGILLPRTNDTHLFLRSEQPGISLESRFSWRVIESVSETPIAEEAELPFPSDPRPDSDDAPPPSPSASQSGFDENHVEQSPPDSNAVPALPIVPPVPNLPDNDQSLMEWPLETPPLIEIPLRRTVRNLKIDVVTANWDRDAEVDGLRIRVQPEDLWGQVIPLDGFLDVELIGESCRSIGGHSIEQYDDFNTLERWSVPIHAVDFDPTGTLVDLTFRRFHPERHLDVASDGFVFAKLRVPGVGSFQAVDDDVVLRPVSRFRDEMQLRLNRRQVPFEGSSSAPAFSNWQ